MLSRVLQNNIFQQGKFILEILQIIKLTTSFKGMIQEIYHCRCPQANQVYKIFQYISFKEIILHIHEIELSCPTR